jgi:hypothetical protein
MSEDKKDAVEATPTLKPEHIEAMLRQMHVRLPHVVEVGKAYNQVYPVATTPPEVINAVTVATPLRDYMLMVGIVSHVLIERHLKAKAANDGTPA